jgi:hypothetical protein
MKNHWLEQKKKKDCGCSSRTDRMLDPIKRYQPKKIKLGLPKGII